MNIALFWDVRPGIKLHSFLSQKNSIFTPEIKFCTDFEDCAYLGRRGVRDFRLPPRCK